MTPSSILEIVKKFYMSNGSSSREEFSLLTPLFLSGNLLGYIPPFPQTYLQSLTTMTLQYVQYEAEYNTDEKGLESCSSPSL